ncbi:hypothetical protein V6N12_049133 [Hibiscus sabdariffa]|uniref:Uncharacterized protein n=1 Tax=Hibiscus sabdariffa TaxID=183260 RepID=A0ABR2EJA9_9ROSI
MGTAAASGSYMANIRPCISSRRMLVSSTVNISTEHKEASWTRLASFSNISSRQPFLHWITSKPVKFEKFVTRAMSEASDNKPLSGLPIDLRGKRAFIAGVADDNGYGWAIAKSLAAAGAEILVGTWVPALNIFESSLRRGKFDESRVLPDGSLMEITKVYPMDAVYDSPEDIPEDVKTNKRYAGSSEFRLDSSGGASISLTYIASERIIPGYGGGMSSAKAALESDTCVMAFEAGRKHKVRVNTISAEEVGNAAAFLASPLSSPITGAVVYVDNGLNAMGHSKRQLNLERKCSLSTAYGLEIF